MPTDDSTPNHLALPTIIAIDGPAGAGKSTIAAALARRLGLPYLDTGAMYRGIALMALRAGLSLPLEAEGATRVERLFVEHELDVAIGPEGETRIWVDGEDVTGEIRSGECSMMASAVSAMAVVRHKLVTLQRRMGRLRGGVMEGRDITTVVFPDAQLKVFLTADEAERARRRYRQMRSVDPETTLDEVERQIRERDRQDASRSESPLRVAEGALVVDSTAMTPSEVVDRLVEALDRSRDRALDSSGPNTVRSRNDAS